MSRHFFIGGNKFYGSEANAEQELAQFQKDYGIPDGIFVIVTIDKEEPGGTFEPLPEATVIH